MLKKLSYLNMYKIADPVINNVHHVRKSKKSIVKRRDRFVK